MITRITAAEAARNMALHPGTSEKLRFVAAMKFVELCATSDLREESIKASGFDPNNHNETILTDELLRKAQEEIENLKRDLLAEQVAHAAGKRLWELHCVQTRQLMEREEKLRAENIQLRSEAASREDLISYSDARIEYVPFETFAINAEKSLAANDGSQRSHSKLGYHF